jgi:hypothetical protein
MEEIKKILGWIVNTRSLTIALPPDKHSEWTASIEAIITAGKCNFKNLEILIGQLNHVANILPSMRHFLGRLYKALHRARKTNWTIIGLSAKSDLHLMSSFLQYAKEGVSINNVVF